MLGLRRCPHDHPFAHDKASPSHYIAVIEVATCNYLQQLARHFLNPELSLQLAQKSSCAKTIALRLDPWNDFTSRDEVRQGRRPGCLVQLASITLPTGFAEVLAVFSRRLDVTYCCPSSALYLAGSYNSE